MVKLEGKIKSNLQLPFNIASLLRTKLRILGRWLERRIGTIALNLDVQYRNMPTLLRMCQPCSDAS